MEIPGIAPFSNQPTLTNPLPQSSQLQGREVAAQKQSETQNTVTAQDQDPTAVNATGVVNQTNETDQAGFSQTNPGGTIDITA
jgi:hypothetical protein